MLHAEHLDRAEDERASRAYLVAARWQAAEYRYELARGLVERGLALAVDRGDQFLLACFEGEILQDLGDMAAAARAYDVALAAAEGSAERCRAWIGLAAVKRVTDDLDGAVADLERAEAEAVAQGLTDDEARIHFVRGNLFFPRGDIDGCLREHGKSLELAQAVGSAELEAAALGGLGDAEYVLGRMISAHDRLRRCVELARQHGFGRIAAECCVLARHPRDRLAWWVNSWWQWTRSCVRPHGILAAKLEAGRRSGRRYRALPSYEGVGKKVWLASPCGLCERAPHH